MASSPAARRAKILAALLARPHRFATLRAIAWVVTLAGITTPSAFGLVGLDLWAGRHRWLGQPTDTLGGVVGVVVGVIAFYAITFIVNALFGRLFCGFGCPSAWLSRVTEQVEVARRSTRWTLRARAAAWSATVAMVLAGATLSWFVHPAVFVEGSATAVATVLGAWVLLAAALLAHGRYARWAFCRKACPIGVYYTVVQTTHARAFGIHFEPERAACRDCGACDEVCPVALEPRRLGLPIEGRGGLSFDGFPASHHCLACGDCVQTCELVLRKGREERLVPLRLGFGAKKRSSPLTDTPAEKTAPAPAE